MNKRRGFTLIELLAIIVILAIIAVITVPIILNIIEESKKGAAINSAYGYKDAVNKYYVTQLSSVGKLKLNDTYNVTDGVLSDGDFGVESVTDLSVQTSGTVPSGGYLVYLNNSLTDGCLIVSDYAVVFSDGIVSNAIKGNCPNSFIVTFDSNGGSSVSSKITLGNRTIKAPSIPSKSGKVFKGWYSDSELTTLFDFTTLITEDVTLYAKWVDAPTMSEMCPNCVFGFFENTMIQDQYGQLSYPRKNKPLTQFEYTSDYTEIDKSVFSGFILDNNENVTNIFSCGIENGIPFCIEGYNSSSAVTEKNLDILDTIFSTCSESSNPVYNSYSCSGNNVMSSFSYGNSFYSAVTRTSEERCGGISYTGVQTCDYYDI